MDKLATIDINEEVTYFNAPLYPITDFKWTTANTIELVIADLPDTTYESIENWSQVTNPPAKRVEIQVE